MNKKQIINKVDKYYTEKIKNHGATSQGVDWNGKDSHYLRFKQLIKVINQKENCSILDYGCGFGALIDFLNEQQLSYFYTGYDISEEMIKKAREIYKGTKNSFFTTDKSSLQPFDYVIANGIFNVKLDTDDENWNKYIKTTLDEINRLSKKGFSFNILTSYSDEEYKKDYLYYANPLEFFDFCKKQFSKNVALLHDYDLYEFTIIVRK